MNCCIFKKSLLFDTKRKKNTEDNFTIDVEWISNLIPSFDPAYSGIWLPVIIKTEDSDIDYVDILSRAQNEQFLFNPCNCVSNGGVIPDDSEDVQLDCSYCNNLTIMSSYSFDWYLRNEKNGESKIIRNTTCCDGACDSRLTRDDYLTKLPVLNSAYLSKFYDWKYKKQFPACSNKGLGKEKLIYTTQLESFDATSAELVIDWKIKERISEIPPNDVDTYHNDIDTHEKSYQRSLLTSKTCGNFILTKLHESKRFNQDYPIFSGIVSDIARTGNFSTLIPPVESFASPYGFKNQDYYNIFVKTKKVGSFWKWNYTSGILCWYRHYNVGLENDDRMIPGVDLFISDGDVFFAKNDGPEPVQTSTSQEVSLNTSTVKSCPSGLKLVSMNTVTGVIPSGSEFMYISTNLYGKFYSILEKLVNLDIALDTPTANQTSPLNKLELAALLSTGPDYHEVTIDLLKTVKDLEDADKDYKRDLYKNIKVFNSGMLLKEQHKLSKLNIVKTKEDLINTLANKYGAYIWIPPNSQGKLESKKSYQSNIYFDLDFEPVVKETDTYFARECRQRPPDCAEMTVSKNFSYNQNIKAGSLKFTTSVDNRYKSQVCVSGNFKIDKSANAIGAYLNGKLVKESYYGSGCTSFYQRYLRPPSYDLALSIVGESLCKIDNLCNEQLARANDKEPGVFKDASVVLHRKYPANFCNTNIDRIGFHKDGGVYYDSNIFGSGNVVFIQGAVGSDGKYSVEFQTKDLGIKLYSLEVYKLRDENNANCKTFPLDQPCKCFPLTYLSDYKYNCNGSLTYTNAKNVLFTPNISTQNSPKIYSYGGYSRKEIDGMIGVGNTIPNHPSPSSVLSTVTRVIDPLNPYECSPYVDVIFDNYVYTKWSVVLPSLYNTSHADVWVRMSENVDLFNPRIPKYDEYTDEYESIINTSYRRYTTKAVINSNKTIYGNQQQILFPKDSSVSNVTIELTNPFLYALLSQMSEDIEKNKLLYSPLSCSYERPSQKESQDPYMIPLTISFKRVPRKQYLAYKLKPLSKIGTLEKSFFHPNSGLIDDENFVDKTSLVYNSGTCLFDFDYERKIFANGNNNYSNSGVMFKGTITKEVKRILDSVDALNSHKKLRLYIKYNDHWYEYVNPHIFGYYNNFNNNVYPGYPSFFEYTKEDKYKTNLPIEKFKNTSLNSNTLNDLIITEPSPLIPASAKDNTKFSFIHNTKNTGVRDLFNQNYPIFYQKFSIDQNANNKILVPGTRAYFLLKEKDPAQIVTSIEEISEEQQENIEVNTFVLDNDKNRWRYINGSKTNKDSYELVPPRDRRDDNFTESFLDYKNVNSKGYLANTNVPTEKVKIYLIDSNNINNISEYYVKSKAIFAPNADKYGNQIPKFKKVKPLSYITTLTSIELDGICAECTVPIKEGYLLIVKPQRRQSEGDEEDEEEDVTEYSPESFVLYQDLNDLLKLEKDSLLSNNIIQTKWGDLIGFDKKTIYDLNNSLIAKQILENLYPKPLYNNILHSITVNNLETGVFNAFFITNYSGTRISSGTYSHTGSVYYNIHQKYNIGLSDYFENTIENYQNYLPYIDINFTNNDEIIQKSWYNNLIENFNNNIISTGNIYISGIRSFTDTTGLSLKPESGSYFFVNIDGEFNLRPILFDKEFYYDSLRVDDVYYRLASLSKEEGYYTAGCRNIFKPNINFSDNPTIPHFFDVEAFKTTAITSHYFNAFPIYCDNDKVSKCTQDGCAIATVGWTRLRAGYNHYEDPGKKGRDIFDEEELEYALSVDEGIYNVVGTNSIPYIQRFEIPPNSNLFPNLTMDGSTNCVMGADDRPNRPQNYIDYEYQTKLQNYILDEGSKGELVKNTDILANEMLFRIIYGAKQKINYETIKKKTINDFIQLKNQESVSYLLQYSSPKVTPDLIYKLIPYDYSTSSDTSKRKVAGNISIDGVLTVGSNVSVTIGDTQINISVARIDGKIYSVVSCNGETEKSLIYDETVVEKYLITEGVASNAPAPKTPTPSSQNQTIKFLKSCDYPDGYGWSIHSYFSSASYTSQDSDGNPIEIDIAAEYNKCVNGIVKCVKEGGGGFCCVNFIDWKGDPPDSSVTDYGCAPPHQVPCVGCDSRGWAPGPGVSKQVILDENGDISHKFVNSLPPNCSIIDSRSAGVSFGGLGRALMGNTCAARQSSVLQLSPGNGGGGMDSLMGGLAVVADGTWNSICIAKQPSCNGYCTPLDFSDKHGKVNTPFRNSTRPGSYGSICECQNYNTGYCAVPESTCSCQEYSAGFPKIFSYDFEYCNYKFSNMRGHITRLRDGEPPVWEPVNQTFICEPQKIVPGEGNGKAEEVCYWVECRYPSTHWYIYESATTTYNEYNPLCPENLCNIIYDNNHITVSLKNNNFCFDNSIRTDCPEITVTLPNSTFSVNDSITSECTECSVESNNITGPLSQVQDWDIITETRTCIISTLTIDGDLNRDVIAGGGAVYVPREICGGGDATFCVCDNCYRGGGGGYQCGQNAPASWFWKYALSCNLNGSPDPTYHACERRDPMPLVTNVGGGFNFEAGSDNGTVKTRRIAVWKAEAEAIYRQYAPCFNHQTDIDVEDLVEGVVPGSCSKVQYGSIGFPGIAWKKDLQGGTSQRITISTRYAYFTYEYRRPRTIQDVFLKENASKCATTTSIVPPDSYNIVEKYKIDKILCQTRPTCKDVSVTTCDSDKYCCQTQRNRRDI